jgi:hypothetical protein
MRIFGKRFFLLVMISVLSVNLIFCGKKEEKNIKNDVVEKVEEKTQEKDAAVETETKKSSEEEEIAYEKGLDEEFTTDGKLHEEKFLNKNFGYPDTADSFKIEKDSEGYFVTEYIDESPILEKDVPIKEEKSRLKLENDVYLVHNNGMVYAYDTKLKKVVILNRKNDFRIMFIVEE